LRDYASGGVALAQLFHCHLLGFVAAAAAGCPLLLARIARPGAVRKLGVLGAIVLAAALPWICLTGFLGHASRIPAARSLWIFPDDYLQYFRLDPAVGTLFVAGVLWVALIGLIRGRLPRRIAAPSASGLPACLFLLLWIAIGYAAFMLLIPAASAFLWRMRLILEGPAILLGSILLAWSARIFSPRHSVWAAALVLLVLVGRQTRTARWLVDRSPEAAHYAIFDYLRGLDLPRGTRLYAAPNYHLTLTYLSGLPVQSIAPVRKSFLDRCEGNILLIDAPPALPRPTSQQILEAADRSRHPLTEAEARAWEQRLATRLLREDLSRRVAEVVPPLEELPDYLEAVLAQARGTLETVGSPQSEADLGNAAIFRGYRVDDPTSYWQVLFYRFVDPVSRSGPRTNFADRLRGARAAVLDGWVVYHFGPPRVGPDRGHPGSLELDRR
jgi:hypothetical protein